MSHLCHAYSCTREVPPHKFVCRFHWRCLHPRVQRAIMREYRPGQERTKKPTARYMAVQRFATAKLAFKPNDMEAAKVAAQFLKEAVMWQERALLEGDGDPLEGLVAA